MARGPADLLPSLRVIRYASFTRTPWKNGGGITHEAVRVPAVGDPFVWRVSVAEIGSSGPFSDFSGYRRQMVLLRGNGISLTFAGGAGTTLREVGAMIEFDGAGAAQCDLVEGSCVDLNLMVRNEVSTAARVQQLEEPLAMTTAPGATVLIFPIGGPIALIHSAAESVELASWDLAIAQRWSGSLVRAPKSTAPTAVFLATIGA